MLVRFFVALDLLLFGKPLEFRTRMILCSIRAHTAARSQDGPAKIFELLVEQTGRILHDNQSAQLGLILEDIQKDGGQAVEFTDFGLGKIVLGDGHVPLADRVARPALQSHILEAMISACHYHFRGCLRNNCIDQLGLRFLEEALRPGGAAVIVLTESADGLQFTIDIGLIRANVADDLPQFGDAVALLFEAC